MGKVNTTGRAGSMQYLGGHFLLLFLFFSGGGGCVVLFPSSGRNVVVPCKKGGERGV
jgi:hypothetical protein